MKSFAKIYLHVIFLTKYRAPLIVDEVRDELHLYLRAVAAGHNCRVLAINSVEDHVRLLISFPRTVTLAKLVEMLKRSSSRWMKTKSPELRRFTWQPGYAAFSVGQERVPVVTRYIARQKEHHKSRSLKMEIESMLNHYQLEYGATDLP